MSAETPPPDPLHLLGIEVEGETRRELAHDPHSTQPLIVTVKDGGFSLLPSFGFHVRF